MDDINFKSGYTLFNRKLDELVALDSQGVTATDKQLLKVEQELLYFWEMHLDGRDKVHRASIRILAYKLRKSSLLRDKEFLKTLSIKERLYAEQMHQDMLIDGIERFLESNGIGIRTGWGPRTLASSIWWNVVMQWSFVQFGVFPKMKSAIGEGFNAADFFWRGAKSAEEKIKFRQIYKTAGNHLIQAWHYAFFSGVVIYASMWVMEVRELSKGYTAQITASAQKTSQTIVKMADRVADPDIDLRYQENVEFAAKKKGFPLTDKEKQAIRKRLDDEQAEYQRRNAEDELNGN